MSRLAAFPDRPDAEPVLCPASAEIAWFAREAPALDFAQALERALADDLARLTARRKLASRDGAAGIDQ